MQNSTKYLEAITCKTRRLAISAILLAGFFLIISARLAYASSISIQPLRQELQLIPGQAITSSLTVRNTGTSDAIVTINAESFRVTNENYDYAFSQPTDLNKWVHIQTNNITIQPTKSHTFDYTRNVPITAEPGGKYIAIFSSTKNQSSTNIVSVERAGQLIYLHIPGATSKKGSILELNMPAISTDKKNNWNTRIHNSGTVHFKSQITANVRSWPFGYSHTYTNEHLILPNTVRLATEQLQFGNIPGIYQVKLTIGLGDTPANSQTRWVVYAPIGPTIIGILFIAVGPVLLSKRIQKKKNK